MRSQQAPRSALAWRLRHTLCHGMLPISLSHLTSIPKLNTRAHVEGGIPPDINTAMHAPLRLNQMFPTPIISMRSPTPPDLQLTLSNPYDEVLTPHSVAVEQHLLKFANAGGVKHGGCLLLAALGGCTTVQERSSCGYAHETRLLEDGRAKPVGRTLVPVAVHLGFGRQPWDEQC